MRTLAEDATASNSVRQREGGRDRYRDSACLQYSSPGKDKSRPKGSDNGYVLTTGGKRVYGGGGTEETPELRALKDIDVAFLPMDLPNTMGIEQAAGAIQAFKPKIVYRADAEGRADDQRPVDGGAADPVNLPQES